MALEHERHVLACGTIVLTRPLEANDIVVARAFVPMGPLYESDEEAGISSVVQGVLTRGTQQRSASEIQDALADLGAEIDASTGSDLGNVSMRATSGTWERVLDLFVETLTAPAFDPREVETEVEQTLGALEAREDQLMARATDLFRDLFYGLHPYRKRVLGFRETVSAFDRERVAAAARRFYRPFPPILVAVGRFDTDVLLGRLDEAFGRTPLVPPPPRPAAPSPGSGARRLELDREAAYLLHGFPAPSWKDADYPAARVLDAILGGSMSSRLFIELREKQALGYQVSSIYNDQLDGSFLAGYIVTDPARSDQAAAGLAVQFRRAVEEPVSEAEIVAARRYLRGAYLIGAETNAAQAMRLGRHEAYGLGQDFGDRWLAAIEAVTPEAIQALARRWFDREPTRAFVVPRSAPAF
ncbi:MAG TPA: pitrilysin family protein [Gemmatimonadota bacterium]|nr:pitrilysin family protein [Gemmatimonadota bacterium]